MAILTINEWFKERTMEQTVDGLKYTRAFHVLTDDPETSEKDILTTTAFPLYPALYQRHPNDDDNILTNKRAKVHEGDRLNWTVVCTYDPRRSTITIDEITDAIDVPPEITFGLAQYERAVDRAFSSGSDIGTTQDSQVDPQTEVRNSAGDEFDPPLVQETTNMVIEITRNEISPDFNPNNIADFIDTLNSSQVTVASVSIAQHQGRIRRISPVKRWTAEGQPYFTVTYEIEVKRDTHIRKILDQGFRVLTGSPLKPVNILNSDIGVIKGADQDIKDPEKLDGAGNLLRDATPPADDVPIYLEFQTYFAKDWGTLNLPSSISD